jgi:hypothetical protein
MRLRRTHIFRLEFLVSAAENSSLQLLQVCTQVLLVLKPQLLVDDLQVPDGVHLALHMRHVLVLKRSCGTQRNLLIPAWDTTLSLSVH